MRYLLDKLSIKDDVSMENSFIEVNMLNAMGPGTALFISGFGSFELTAFDPPVQRAVVVGVNLPAPGTFGPYDNYNLILKFVLPDTPPQTIDELILKSSPDRSIWSGVTLLTFECTLDPIRTTVRPQGQRWVGEPILQGFIFGFNEDNDEETQ